MSNSFGIAGGFAKSSPSSVLLTFLQSCVKHDLRKK
jgi:hypothetical protein